MQYRYGSICRYCKNNIYCGDSFDEQKIPIEVDRGYFDHSYKVKDEKYIFELDTEALKEYGLTEEILKKRYSNNLKDSRARLKAIRDTGIGW